MSPRAVSHRGRRLPRGINLTPMLDLIFNLLFFFILATRVRDANLQMEVTLPASTTGDEAPAQTTQPPPSLTIDEHGRIVYKGRAMAEAEVRLELHHLAREGEREIVVRGDRAVPYGRVVTVMDLCKEAGLQAVVLDLRRAPQTVKE